MVKKLFKYEIRSFARIILPINLILIVLAAFGRILQFFDNDSIAYNILFGSAMFTVIAGCVVSVILVYVISIVRFYKNLFGTEGYLSFTLPVTPAQHIFVKLATTAMFLCTTYLSIYCTLAILMSGEFLGELFRAIGYLAALYFAELSVDGVFYLLEFLILSILMLAFEFLLYYTCIAIGQRARKNRIITAVASYYGIYMISQVIITVLFIIFTILTANGLLDGIFDWIAEHPRATFHLVFCGGIVLNAGLATAAFLFTNHTMKHKLNLE